MSDAIEVEVNMMALGKIKQRFNKGDKRPQGYAQPSTSRSTDSIQALNGPWLSIPEASSWSGLPVLIFLFSLEFIHTCGLYKVSPRVHTSCLCSERVCTWDVLVTVVCLIGYFFSRVGQSSPPLMRSIPLRCLSLGLNSQ
jgi:hypothetical protein